MISLKTKQVITWRTKILNLGLMILKLSSLPHNNFTNVFENMFKDLSKEFLDKKKTIRKTENFEKHGKYEFILMTAMKSIMDKSHELLEHPTANTCVL